jgi:glycerophosphoryl diester phosphodiesterase
VLRQYDPRIRLGVLDHTPNFGIKFKLINEIKAYSYHPNFLKLEQSDVEKLHAQNLLIYPYTANSTADFERLQKQKVNGIITNQIEDLLTYLEKTL